MTFRFEAIMDIFLTNNFFRNKQGARTKQTSAIILVFVYQVLALSWLMNLSRSETEQLRCILVTCNLPPKRTQHTFSNINKPTPTLFFQVSTYQSCHLSCSHKRNFCKAITGVHWGLHAGRGHKRMPERIAFSCATCENLLMWLCRQWQPCILLKVR